MLNSTGPIGTLYYQENKISQVRCPPSPAQVRTIIQESEATPKLHPVRLRVMTTDKDFGPPPTNENGGNGKENHTSTRTA